MHSIGPDPQLDPQCRKIHDPGAMDLAPYSTLGPWEICVLLFDWEHSHGAMILGPIQYKEWCWCPVHTSPS